MRRLSLTRSSFGILIIAASFVAAACGGDDKKAPPTETIVGGPMASGSGGGAGTDNMTPYTGEFNLPGSPVIELVVGDGEQNVFTDSVEARCTIAQSSEADSLPFDPATVRFQLLDKEGMEVLDPVAEPGEMVDEFVTDFAVSSLSAGAYALRCFASDTGTTAKTGMSEVPFYVDRGPAITLRTPEDGEFVSAVSVTNFEFVISAAELFDADPGAEISGTPQVVIHGSVHDLLQKPGSAGVYWLDGFDLADPSNFEDEPPLGPTLITVRATNVRGVEAEKTFSITVDSEGPIVTIKSPQALEIIGNAVSFVFEATDDFSGIDWETVKVTLGEVEIGFDSDLWVLDGDEATLTIQTSDYAGSRDLSLNVDVRDGAGNLRIGAATGTYHLDQFGPILSLDPPMFRTRKSTGECSHAFDPVGDSAENYGGNVDQFAFIRGIAWDRTNAGGGGTQYYSSVAPATVALWVAAAGKPLVIDTDNDGTCDWVEIDQSAAQVVKMDKIAPTGTNFFGDGTNDSSEPPLVACAYSASATPDTPKPDKLCTEKSSDMFYVAAHDASDGEIPAIYGFGVGTSYDCTGGTFEVPNFISLNYEGWVCAALVAKDQVGNSNVSEPLAFCLDNDRTAETPPCWGVGAAGAPDCTDGCAPVTFPATGAIIED